MNAATFNKTFDALTLLKDAGAVTASGTGQVGGSARIIDLAGDPSGTSLPPTAGMGAAPDTPGEVLVDVSAADGTDGNETYEVYVEVSTSPTFASGNLIVGRVPVPRGATGVGRYLIPYSNWQNRTYYRYVRVGHTLGGTTPSLNYVARLGKSHN